jgi:hypothetical protein
MLEREDKPLLRLSAVKPGAPPTIVNVGKGVAFTSAVLKADRTLLRFFWTVRGGERAEASELEFMKGETYLLYCQDIAGRWHLTRATPEAHRTHNRFVGVVKTNSVPEVVSREAQVDSA